MLNPGGKTQQSRMQASTENGVSVPQPPGGVENLGGSAAATGRKEPPGGKQTEQAKTKPENKTQTDQTGQDQASTRQPKTMKQNQDNGISPQAIENGGVQTGSVALATNSSSGGSAEMSGSIPSGHSGVQMQTQKKGQSSSAQKSKKPKLRAGVSGRTGTEPSGGTSKTQVTGQTDSSTVGQGSVSGFTRENDEPNIQSESMTGTSSKNAESAGRVSSMADDVKQQEAEPMRNASERVQIGHISATGNGSSNIGKNRISKQESGSGISNAAQSNSGSNFSAGRRNSTTEGIQPTGVSGNLTQPRSSNKSSMKKSTLKVEDQKTETSKRGRIGHTPEPPKQAEKPDNS